jgi:hypothetical protein
VNGAGGGRAVEDAAVQTMGRLIQVGSTGSMGGKSDRLGVVAADRAGVVHQAGLTKEATAAIVGAEPQDEVVTLQAVATAVVTVEVTGTLEAAVQRE